MQSRQSHSEENGQFSNQSLRTTIHRIIFDADTPAAKAFDIALFIAIVLSILGMMLESVESIDEVWSHELRMLDWVLTALFTVEYGLRIWTTRKPIKYILSFYGLVDLFSILPTYAAFFFVGAQSLSVIRAVRLLRVFRVLKLVQFVGEASSMAKAIKASYSKIIVFIAFVLIVSTIIGTLMFLIEGRENGFKSIPHSIYWAIVTLTTVGYGDVSPGTPLGQILAILLMVMGYGVIAVPTGLVTAEAVKQNMVNNDDKHSDFHTCPNCSFEGNSDDANFCKKCGYRLLE